MNGIDGYPLHPSHLQAGAPESLDNVLDSLQTLLDHSRHRPVHSLAAPRPTGIRESFASETAEQYDDPLVLEDNHPQAEATIPVLDDVVVAGPVVAAEPAPVTANANIDRALAGLRAELEEMIEDILLDARNHLQQADVSDEAVIDAGLKQFVADLLARLPR